MLVLRLARVGGWMGLLQATRSVRRAQPHSKPHRSSRTASRSGPLRERLGRPRYFLVERFPDWRQLMNTRLALAAFCVALAASACERVASPTATREPPEPSFAIAPGQFKSFMVPTKNSQPLHIALGSDAKMWFTESQFDNGKIGRVD